MGTVCQHEFTFPGKSNPGYSDVEYDLYAKLDMTIRKNLTTGLYEIAKISTGQKVFQGNLTEAVKEANRLEGTHNTTIACGIGCPLKFGGN